MKKLLFISFLILHFSVSAQINTETDSVKTEIFSDEEEIIVTTNSLIRIGFPGKRIFYYELPRKFYGGGGYISQGFASGNYAEYFTNPFSFGFTSPFSFGFTGRLGINRWIAVGNCGIFYYRQKEELIFENSNDWHQGGGGAGIELDINIGYRIIQPFSLGQNYFLRRISMFPFAGIGFTMMSPPEYEKDIYSAYLPYYKVGISTNYYIGEDFWFFMDALVNLEFGVKLPLTKHEYSNYFDGKIAYIKLGLEVEELFRKRRK
jgi:hypothetical protein